MLRYIFLKLSGFTSKKEFSISSSCNQMLMFRSSSPVRGEFCRVERSPIQTRPHHKRSYSFPSHSTRSSRLLDNESVCGTWIKPEPQECQVLNPNQMKSIHHNPKSKNITKKPNSLKSVSSQALSGSLMQKKQPDKGDPRSKYHEMSSFDESDRYQLEASRPRRSRSELVFNVFDYVARDVDLTDYLQPSNLRPFGSNDNIYLPLLMSHKNLNLTSQNNPEYLQSLSDVENPEQDNPKTDEGTASKNVEPILSNPVNKFKEAQFKNTRPYKDIIRKHKELNPLFMPKIANFTVEKRSPPPEKPKEELPVAKNVMNSEKATNEDKKIIEFHKPSAPKSSVAIEPPPFLAKREDMFPTISFVDMGLGAKRNMANYRRMRTPWPAYSDHVKNMAKKNLMDNPIGSAEEKHNDAANAQDSMQRKVSQLPVRNISTEKVRTGEDTPKAPKKQEVIKNNVGQRRALSTKYTHSKMVVSPTGNVPKPTKSSVYASKNVNKDPVTQSLISLNTREVNVCPSHSYTKSSRSVRKFEPKSCKTPEKRKRCFLPSKVRLKPPKCTTSNYEVCPPPPCCHRADDCLRDRPKKLPTLKEDDCKCVEATFPTQNPKMKRLEFNFVDEPRVCPCVPGKCPCPDPPPRADDLAKPKEKKLSVYVPGSCECIEPPPMTTIQLVRLKKVCEPEERCWPQKPCPVEETCEERERADDCLTESVKPLPRLKVGTCSCVEALVPNVNPKMRKLKFEFEDPPKVCPCDNPCECPGAPIRADDCVEEKVKKLPSIEIKECPCTEPPPMVDVPLKRLKPVCTPEVCMPQKKCPEEEPCECVFRADMCMEEEPKKLPKLEPMGCECFEPHQPNQNPKLKRLHMEFADEPKVCPCVPVKCPCPPPVRADDLAPPKQKKLAVYMPGDCKCIEPPPMTDIPLIRLKKVCEPEERCWPQKPCPVEELCEDKVRADDCLYEEPKKLPPIQAKPCPCRDYMLKDAPKLKRLSLAVPEPSRVCPPEKRCPPQSEKCARADDCAPQKIKKLQPIMSGACPCVDQPMTDVKPLPRLKCREEPEECHYEDPCYDYPRADWGCWEYTQEMEEPRDKYDMIKMDNDLNYKQKRKFNTDCRACVENCPKAKGASYQTINCTSKKNLSSQTVKNTSDVAKQIQNKLLRDTKTSTQPGGVITKKTNALKSITMIGIEEDNKPEVHKSESLHRNNSLPTLFLLKELNKMKRAAKKVDGNANKSGPSSIFTKMSQNSFVSSSMRSLSTAVTNAKKTTSFYLGMAQVSSDSTKDCKDAPKPKPTGKRRCPKLNKCDDNHFVAKECPEREQRTCAMERLPVCCEKKPSPNPAFSECMNEEIKPFSNARQWTCDRKEYGFDPRPKNPNEPLNTVKEKKKFSTSVPYSQNLTTDIPLKNAENSVVSYFSARYSKTQAAGQSKKTKDGILDRAVKDGGGYKRTTERNYHGVSDVTCCRTAKNDFVSVKQKYSKLSNQKSNYTVADSSYGKIRTGNKGYATRQSNTSGLLPFRPSCSQNVLRKNMSTLNNSHIIEDTGKTGFSSIEHSHRQYSKDSRNADSKCKFPNKKKNCPKFEVTDCPEKARNTCKYQRPEYPCNKKHQAPYPSFSELVDDELEKRMTECPVEEEKIIQLQPKYPIPFNKPPILDPIVPQQGKLDPKIEEACIRERLCLKNEGLTQDCKTFGQFVKPMKSKDYIKHRNKDCDRIEELKKMGRWPPRNQRGFCTCVSVTSGLRGRNTSSFVHVPMANNDENLLETDRGNQNEMLKLRNAQEEEDRVLDDNQLMEMEGTFDHVKPGNIQWKIDNFRKWCRLKKMSSNPRLVKRYHTCSKLKYRKFVKRKPIPKPLSTSTARIRVGNLNVRGIICSKLKYRRFQRNRPTPKHLSISTIKTPIEKSNAQRDISTTAKRATGKKHKCIRFPLYPKPIKKAQEKIPNLPQQMKRVEQSPEYIEKHTRPLRLGHNRNMRTWQPKYPGVPEIDTPTVPQHHEHQPHEEPSWKKECMIHFTEQEKGKSWDCSAVEKPFIRLNTSNLEARVMDTKEDAVPCFPCGEVFMRSSRVQAKTRHPPRQRLRAAKCPKQSHPCQTATKQKFKVPCPGFSKQPRSYLPPKILSSPAVMSMWQKVINYFKAKPNCPGPDDWKKRALREKAEKAAKAAGLCLVEPQDLRQAVSKKSGRQRATDSDNGCFPRKNPCKTSTRHYSSGVNWGNSEEVNKLLEEEKKKQPSEKLSQVLKDETSHDEDANLKCPDPLFESILKEAILRKNSLSFLEKNSDSDKKDERTNYALKIIPSDVNIFDDFVREPSIEESKFDQSKQISDYQEYFSKIDSLSDISHEELEKIKTKTLVNELDKLLKENQKPQKKS